MDKNAERRRYFRVTDLVGLHYRFLTEGERELALASQPASLSNLLSTMEDEINVILHAIKQTNPELQRLLELYNEKINLAFGHGLASKDQQNANAVRACQVSISACGIAFPSQTAAQLWQSVALDLTLYPSNVRLQLMATVISCEEGLEGANDPYIIRADFESLSDNDQELLVQHVIKRQAQQLKDQRANAQAD